MAAAPNLPLSDAITWDITIDDTYNPSRQGIVVNQGDQINFENESGVDIIIEFQPNVYRGQNQTPVYPPMNLSVSNGGSNSFTAPNANCAANYYIYNADVTPPAQLSGPFAIQVGTGTIYVTVGGTVSNPTYSPESVAVPLGSSLPPGAGNLQMNTGASSSFGITWKNNNDPFTPPIAQTDGSPHGVAQISALTTYTYYGGPSPVENPAGGRVIVQG
jgi:hypothetical protein